MKFAFLYDLQKDIENYKVASKSINSTEPTKMQARYIAEFGNVFEDQSLELFIKKVLVKQKLDMQTEAERFKMEWQTIESEYLKRVERIFGIKSPLDIIRIYLTTDGRCSYNTSQGYFFISATRQGQNKTIMHELLHFWTGWLFYQEVEGGRMTYKDYNDVKESLTELLNLEFKDLLGEAEDGGYPQHQALRAIVRTTWNETKDIQQVFKAISKACIYLEV